MEPYSLLDINRSSVIFAGGSDEGLFEIAQNINFNEIFMMNAKFSDNVSYSCLNKSMPLFCYSGDYLMTLFPMYEDDARKELWFDEKSILHRFQVLLLKKSRSFGILILMETEQLHLIPAIK